MLPVEMGSQENLRRLIDSYRGQRTTITAAGLAESLDRFTQDLGAGYPAIIRQVAALFATGDYYSGGRQARRAAALLADRLLETFDVPGLRPLLDWSAAEENVSSLHADLKGTIAGRGPANRCDDQPSAPPGDRPAVERTRARRNTG